MSPTTVKERTEVISVVCSMSLEEMPQDVKALEERIMEKVGVSGLEFYALCFRRFQERWLEQQRAQYTAVRWRAINQVSAFGLLKLPVRVVRRRADGRYFTLSKALLAPKATRLLSPWVERCTLEAVTGRNYRPAALELWRWAGVRVSAWLIWRCVQFHGRRLVEQLERGWWPDRAVPKPTPIIVEEMDSTVVKKQERARATHVPVKHFPMHLGLHYAGRARRYARRGSRSVKLQQKRWILSAQSMALFGRRLACQGLRHFGAARHHVLLSDGDEGLEWVREREFPSSTWLLDRWHISRAVRELVGSDQEQYRSIMRAVWRADSEAVLQALAESPLQQSRPEQFHALFGYLLGNREGIDNWRLVPASLRRSIGRQLAPVRAGSGAIEKNVEVYIARRFKRQGRSWSRRGAEHLAQLLWLQSHPSDWTHWWQKTALAKTRVNPGWPSCAPPTN